MKKSASIFLVVAFAIFAIADFLHDFFANDTAHYFAEQPHRLLLVAAIGIVGGLSVFGFYKLSPRLQRRAKLVSLGLAASFVMLAGGYFSFFLFRLPAQLDSAIPHHMPLLMLLGTIAIAGLLWFEFYDVFRHDRVA